MSRTLECREIVFEYQTADRVLDGVSLTLPQEKIFGLVGRSGVGKSTLLNMIGGYLRPLQGEILWDGQSLERPVWSVQPIYQEDSLWPWLNVRDNVLLANRFSHAMQIVRGQRLFSNSDAEAALQSVGLTPEIWDKWPKELSVGMRKRVELARILLYRPALILADEPFAALDIVTKRALAQILFAAKTEQHVSILFSSHDLDDVILLCERIYVLGGRNGARIVETIDNEYAGLFTLGDEIDHGRLVLKNSLIRALEAAGSA